MSSEHREPPAETNATSLAAAQELINELRTANEHLVMATLAADELREAAHEHRRRQDEFLAMLAHELRNPLAPLRSAADILRLQAGDDARLARVGETIERQVSHLTRLVDDLLDAARVTQNKIVLQRRPVAVQQFIEHSLETFRGAIRDRGQRLVVQVPEEPLYVDGDPVRLAQILGNLLHNASKYSERDGEIGISAAAEDQAIVIRVSDQGAGIPAELLSSVFDLFTQEQRSLGRTEGGLGIGLTVVRDLVALHGGNVEARSEGLGRGSEFVVTLPRVEPDAVGGADCHGQAHGGARAGQILLVEDNADAAELLAMSLRSSGYDVLLAPDGPSGLATFTQEAPDMVICDIGLPGMNGYEVARRMREHDAGHRSVLLALTGYGSANDRREALASGFDHHLVKPASPDELMQLIDSSLQLMRSGQGPAHGTPR